MGCENGVCDIEFEDEPLDYYDAALSHYGIENQQLKLAEECTELAQAVIKFTLNQSPLRLTNLTEEIADVEIMIEQIKRGLGINNAVTTWKANKIQRESAKINFRKAVKE